MFFEILMYASIAYLCYRAVIYRRRQTRKLKEKMREKNSRK